MEQIKIIYEILNNEHVYSLNKLSLKLKERGVELSNEDILFLMVEMLYQEMCNFKIEKKYASNNLYKCFKYLNSVSNYKYINNIELMVVRLEKIIHKIENKIQKKKFNINGICRDNIDFLNKIKTNLELAVIQIRIPNIDKIEEQDDYEKVLYKFIFEIKKFEYVREIFKTFPELINYKTKNNKYILDDVITKYLESLNNFQNDTFDALYYEKIIDLFIQSENFNITNSYKDVLIKRLKLALIDLKNNELSVRKYKKIIFSLTNMIERLLEIDTTVDEKFFSKINYRYGIRDSYGDSYKYEIYEKTLDCETVDMQNLYTVTIDSKCAKSYDDAISMQKTKDGYIINVFITDVTSYVERNTKLDQLTYKKGSTIYLPEYSLTMLPHILTYDQCSLIKNEKRRAINHQFTFSESMDLIDFKVFDAFIKVDDNLSFDSLEEIINGDDVEKLKYFQTLLEISQKLEGQNLFNKNYNVVKKMEKQVKFNIDKEYSFNDFMQLFMILTNYFTSKTFLENDHPLIYRNNNSTIDNDLIEQLKNEDEGAMSLQILDCVDKMNKASSYSDINTGHQGLQLSTYAHVTTPIRNYSALFNQYLIHKYIIDKTPITDQSIYEDEEQIAKIANYLNDRIYYNQEYVDEYVKVYKKKKKNDFTW